VRALVAAGVRAIDVAGAGGSSFPLIEAARATSTEARALGLSLGDWGIPTAACIGAARAVLEDVGEATTLIASGGVRDGIDAARALALGADLAGIAQPVLASYVSGGKAAARRYVRNVVAQLRAACLLVGASTPAELRSGRAVVLEPLSSWVEQLCATARGSRGRRR
jgi:isopentenyl-diphosphate delta-isomerase